MYHYISMKLFDLVLNFKTEKELKELFELILTDRERELVEERLDIIQKLLEEKPHRTIAEEGEHSISQVTAGSKAIRKIKPETKSKLEKLLCSPKNKHKALS